MEDTTRLPAVMQERQEVFAQAAAILAAQGIEITPEVMAYMQPLLNGEQDYAKHEATLQAMIDKLES